MQVDTFASEAHFADHLAPVFMALNELGAMGDFIVGSALSLAGWPLAVHESEDPTRPVLVASYGDLKKVRRAGRTRIALGEHGYGQSYGGHPDSADHGSYAGGQDREDVGLFLVPNGHAAQRNLQRDPAANVKVVGCAKLDTLPVASGNDGSQGPTVALGFHFDAHSVAPEATGTIRHYKAAFPELARDFSVIGHGHPRVAPLLARHYKRYGIEYVPDFMDVCRRADLYVCDNSSTLYEFASTGRPVVVLNGPQYRREISHGLRFWDAADVGVQVNGPDELADAIRYALTDPPEQQAKRKAALRMVYAYPSGGARRAANALSTWAES